MSRRLILDGYNIINFWSTLKTLKGKSLQLARDELIKMMSEYQALSGDKVIIVFDGARVEGLKQEEEIFGIRVIFSRPPLEADSIIERLIYKDDLPSSIIVVTSDSLIRNFALGIGASSCSPQNLEEEVTATIEEMRRNYLGSKGR
jgi:hypothetical protein